MSEYAPPRGKPVDIGEYGIHVLSFGSGLGVVCLHGGIPGASAHSSFKGCVEAIVGADHRAVLVDLLGFGYSSQPSGIEYSVKLLADTVYATLEKLGVSGCIVLGESIGGAVGLRLALDYPELVYDLVLVAPRGIETPETHLAMPAVVNLRDAFADGKADKGAFRKVLEGLVHDKALITDEFVAERYALLEDDAADVTLVLDVPSMLDEVRNIKCPIHGFWGQNDQLNPVTGAAALQEASADVNFTVFPDCGHLVTLEKSAEFNAALGRILTGEQDTNNVHTGTNNAS